VKAVEFSDHLLLFVIVPKVASRAIRRALAPLLGLKPHAECADFPYVSHGGRRAFPHHLRFAFVRNPWDRLVSCYCSKLRDRPTPLKALRRFGWDRHTTFERFVAEVHGIDDRKADEHFQSQSALIRCGGELCVDFLGRFERMAGDWERLARMTGGIIPETLPRFGGSDHAPYREWYTPATAEMVGERYARDIAEFGYEF